MGQRIRVLDTQNIKQSKLGPSTLSELLESVIDSETKFITVAKNLIPPPWKSPVIAPPIHPHKDENLESVKYLLYLKNILQIVN